MALVHRTHALYSKLFFISSWLTEMTIRHSHTSHAIYIGYFKWWSTAYDLCVGGNNWEWGNKLLKHGHELIGCGNVLNSWPQYSCHVHGSIQIDLHWKKMVLGHFHFPALYLEQQLKWNKQTVKQCNHIHYSCSSAWWEKCKWNRTTKPFFSV